MSLIDHDDELIEEISPRKKNNFLKNNKTFSKIQHTLIILIIGIIIGIIIGHIFLEPLLSDNNNQLKNCLETKEALSKENYCLYNNIINPIEIIQQCTQQQKLDK